MRIPRQLVQCFIFLALLPTEMGAQSAPVQQKITFVQLTDAHLFDDNKSANSAALVWAIAKVNGLVAAGSAIDFIVYTGDLGLSNLVLPPGLCQLAPMEEEKAGPDPLSVAVDTLAQELNELAVRKVYFLPGNNDLAHEQLGDMGRYQCFLSQLQARLRNLASGEPSQPQPLELATLETDSTFEVNGIRLLGFNNATLKNKKNYRSWCSKTPDTPAKSAIRDACPQVQLDQLAKSLQTAPSAVLFTHMPYLKDPNPARAKKLPGAWDIPETLRAEWEREACGNNVVAVFAGHFHGDNRDLYGAKSREALRVTECVAKKSWVAPPLALKRQEGKGAQARGLLLATVTPSEVTGCTIYWYDAEAGSVDSATTSSCQ